jgi:hypothetical protein
MKRILALLVVTLLVAMMLPFSVLAAEVPPELATAFPVGTWPLAAGSYDPALDGNGITDGTEVYGLFDAAYTVLEAPTSLAGYTAVTSAADVTAGTYYVLVGSSGFNYGLEGGAGGAAAPAQVPADEPAPAASGGDVDSILSGLTVSTSAVGANTAAFDMPSLAATTEITDQLAAIGYSEDASGLAEVTVQAPNTYSTFDLASMGWGTTVTLYVYTTSGVGAAAPAPAAPATPAASGNVPPELAGTVASGKWPLAAGMYDPGLDGNDIPGGADIFGCFDPATYAPTNAPTSISGYTEVQSISEVTKGTYYVLAASSGFTYIVIGIGDVGGVVEAPAAPPPAGTPAELAMFYTFGGANVWPIAAGEYEPSLHNPRTGKPGILNGSSVFGAFNRNYERFTDAEIPSSLAGYTKVDTAPEVRRGSYTVWESNQGYTYFIVGVGDVEIPGVVNEDEGGVKALADLAGTFPVGIWPLPAGQYDPGLDGNFIPSGMSVYGLFDASYAVVDPPENIEGFKLVDSAAEVTEGTYFILNTSSGFGYIIIGDGGAVTLPQVGALLYDYRVFYGEGGTQLIWCVVFGVGISFPLGVIVWRTQKRESTSGGVKYAGIGKLKGGK